MKTIQRLLVSTAGIGVLAAALAVGSVPAQAQSVLRVVPPSPLVTRDPLHSGNAITGMYGYLIYDQLFGIDENLNPKPQMVESYEMSEDGRTYTFNLRSGLRFHDGRPVRSADVIASIKRWGTKNVGAQTMGHVQALEARSDSTFVIQLKEPWSLLIPALGYYIHDMLFIMPEDVANTPPKEQIESAVGSGPFMFVEEEWVPGRKVVFEKFDGYEPRSEPASFMSGGKVARVDRVEFVIIKDKATANAALQRNEVDFVTHPDPDLVNLLRDDPNVVVEYMRPFGRQGRFTVNHLHAPFNHPKARQALSYVVNQEKFLAAIVGRPDQRRTCYSYFNCQGPLTTEAGTEALKAYDPDMAKQLLEEAGYADEPVTLIVSNRHPPIKAIGLVLASELRNIGVNVDYQELDWSVVLAKRRSKEPPSTGKGWHIFPTYSDAISKANPSLVSSFASSCEGEPGYPGWACDRRITQLKEAIAATQDRAEQKRVAEELQLALTETVPQVIIGEWLMPSAYRAELEGVLKAPLWIFWNLEK